jgi:hypothetical protein
MVGISLKKTFGFKILDRKYGIWDSEKISYLTSCISNPESNLTKKAPQKN